MLFGLSPFTSLSGARGHPTGTGRGAGQRAPGRPLRAGGTGRPRPPRRAPGGVLPGAAARGRRFGDSVTFVSHAFMIASLTFKITHLHTELHDHAQGGLHTIGYYGTCYVMPNSTRKRLEIKLEKGRKPFIIHDHSQCLIIPTTNAHSWMAR